MAISKGILAFIAVFLITGACLAAPLSNRPRPIVQLPTSTYGSWTLSPDDEYVEAFTANSSGSTFGILCGTICVYYVDIGISCEDGHRYPALVNNRAGSKSIVLTCLVLKKRYVMIPDAQFTDEIVKGGLIGFAVPLESGLFSVVRFSLEGAARAVIEAARIAKRRKPNDLRDFTL